MSRTEELLDGPPHELRFHRRIRLRSALKELWHARELIRTLAERDLRARYKQAALGFAWALVTPLALMVVFTLVIPRVGNVNTEGVPYPLFTYVGLIPWTFFSASLTQGGLSLIVNYVLLNKVYCPREVFPIAGMTVAGVDSLIATGALVVLFFVTGFMPKPTSVWVPVLLMVQVAFTLGVTLVASVVMVYYRDVRHLLPIVLQLGLFATPVAYGIEVIPASVRTLYCVINPLAPVIDGYRDTVLYGQPPDFQLLIPGAIASAIWLVGGYLAFKHLETGIADVA